VAAYLSAMPHVGTDEALDLRRRAAGHLLRSGRLDEGLDVAGEVLAAIDLKLPTSRAGTIASLLWQRARTRMRGLDFTARDERDVPAAELARLDTLWELCSGFSVVDRLRGSDLGARHLLEALRVGEPTRIARGLVVEASALRGFGHARGRKQSAHMLALLEELAVRVDRPYTHGMFALCATMIAYMDGRWADSVAMSRRAEQIFRERCVGVPWELATSHMWQANALHYLGELATLQRELPRWIRLAEERGDLYGATTLRTSPGTIAWLARDDVDGLRDNLRDAMQAWTGTGFHLQHYYELTSQAQADLYAGEPAAGYARIEKKIVQIERAFLTKLQIIRVVIHYLRGRCAVGAGLRAVAMRDADRLEDEGLGAWGNGLALLIRAGLENSPELYDEAARRCAEASMMLHAAAARWRQGELLGGQQGEALITAARTTMREQEVLRPERMVSVFAPRR
jgi:hypothetical protein